MWCVTLILIAVASCNAETYELKTAELTAPSTSRIIGGESTTIETYPSMVQVLADAQFICGGSLVTSRHVLSAAHCFVDNFGYVISASRVAIRMGTTFVNTGGSLHEVSRIIVHESYNSPVRDNDIAVVVLSSPATVSSTVQLASIAAASQEVPDDSLVTAVGWGVTSLDSSSASTVLNEVTLRKINLTICAARYLALEQEYLVPFPVTGSMMCAGLLDEGGKDTCSGDSGGPLLYGNVLVGITSWGYSCAESLYPSVYTRVSHYTNWIEAKVRNTNRRSQYSVDLPTKDFDFSPIQVMSNS
uniref:Peptidase S1 domain-containing protein n=1 Tax=Heliothis virescens TaxID=7102 RepID=A0A2A4JRB9_HELVI